MISTHNASSADFDDILALQEANHLTVLPEDARGDGFLTTYLTPETLTRLCDLNGLVIARGEAGQLAGFAGAHHWDLTSERPWHVAVRQLFPLQLGEDEINALNSFQYGPACVSGEFRGQGVIEAMLRGICANFAAGSEFGITFIDHRNARSLAAHERKLGLQIVADLPFDETIYRVLGFEVGAFL